MKKALIAILLILAVCTAAVFAKGYENYSGIGVGFGFSWAKVNGGDDGGRFWRAGEAVFSATDYGFFEKSPVGLFVDASFVIVPNRLTYGGGLPDVELDTRLGFSAMIGPAFKFDLNKKLDLLLGVGFQAAFESYKIGPEEGRNTFYGVGFNTEVVYGINDDFAVTGGITGSMFFAGVNKFYLSGESHSFSYDSFFEIRVIPKIALYFVY